MSYIGWGEGPFSNLREADDKDKKCADCGKPGLKLNADGVCPACVKARAKEDGLMEAAEYPKTIKARGDREDVTYVVKNKSEEDHLNQLLKTAEQRGGSERLQRLAAAKQTYGKK
jgi:uncharacterized Zn finger protein (UPF0148 family)